NDGGASNNVVTQTFTVSVNAVNSQPTLNALGNLTLNENAGLQTVNLSGITSGAANESQTLTVTAVSSNPALIPTPTVNYTSANSTGSISFSPAINASGIATISVTVNDGGASNNVVTQTFTVAVNAVNSQPTLNSLGNLSINENAGLQTVNLSGITSGAANETQTLTVTAVSSNPALIPTPTVNYTSANSTGSISFSPAINASGIATISVTVNDGGASNNVVTQTFTVAVNVFNQTPTLNPIGDLNIYKNADLQTVSLSGITSGATNEIQTLTVTAVSSDPALIPTPTIDYTNDNTTGTLSFTAVKNAYGTATITVTVDDGQAISNLVSRSFLVTVDSAKQPPTLNGIGNLKINKNAGLQTVNLSGISSGSTNEVQPLTVTAVSSDPALIPTPTVNYDGTATTGTLSFIPANNATGTATITVTVDDAQAQSNSVSRSFTVTINPISQVATLDPISDLFLTQNSGLHLVSLSGIAPGVDAFNKKLKIKITASSSNPALIKKVSVKHKKLETTGTLKFKLMKNAVGTTTITVTMFANGGTVVRAFNVTVLAPSTNSAVLVANPAVTLPPPTAILTPADHAPGEFALTVSDGETGRQYIIQASENMTDWVPVHTNTAPFTFVDTQANQFKQRFYRSVLPVP
ncbi:MAG: Ig-like domain-containing protein, partial [Verrucomicrobiales bacterium]|nr:Ig-like domain-containing protein [Verrucomicrobiales bacterium]